MRDRLSCPNGFRVAECWNSASTKSSIVGWHEARKPVFSITKFVAKYFPSQGDNSYCKTIYRIFSQARKTGFCSFFVEEYEENLPKQIKRKTDDDVLLKSKIINGLCNGFQKSMVYRISFFKSTVDNLPRQEDFIGYAVVKKDVYSEDKYKKYKAECDRGYQLRTNKKYDTVSSLQPEESVASDGEFSVLYVYESVMKSYLCLEERGHIHCNQEHSVAYEFAGGVKSTFFVSGILYAQQNKVSTSCAYVALRTVIAAMIGIDVSYNEIDNLVNQYRANKSFTKKGYDTGLISDEECHVLSKFNIHTYCNTVVEDDIRFEIYAPIESGCPCLLSFEAGCASHIVPVFGHTFSEDAWSPLAQKSYLKNNSADSNHYFSSSEWLSSYIMHDDNFGNYHSVFRSSLPMRVREDLSEENKESKDKKPDRSFITLLYDKKQEHSKFAEKASFEYLKSVVTQRNARLTSKEFMIECPWYKHFYIDITSRQYPNIVMRPIYVTKESYIEHLHSIKLDSSTSFVNVKSALHKIEDEQFVWLIEISSSNFFASSRQKYGEVILLPQEISSSDSFTKLPVILIRLPGILFSYKEESKLLETPLKFTALSPLFRVSRVASSFDIQ